MKKRGRYSKSFKEEAVRLLELGEKPVSEIARELDVKRTLLYRWRDEFRLSATHQSSLSNKDQASEVLRLKQELKIVKEERDILKKAAAYFAKDLK